jgi:hypothetical protein
LISESSKETVFVSNFDHKNGESGKFQEITWKVVGHLHRNDREFPSNGDVVISACPWKHWIKWYTRSFPEASLIRSSKKCKTILFWALIFSNYCSVLRQFVDSAGRDANVMQFRAREPDSFFAKSLTRPDFCQWSSGAKSWETKRYHHFSSAQSSFWTSEVVLSRDIRFHPGRSTVADDDRIIFFTNICVPRWPISLDRRWSEMFVFISQF